MFSPVGAPKDDQPDIDWIGDLKFYMDNNDQMLNKHFFPAVNREEKFPKEKLEELAKQIATQQEKFMEKGDYDK